MRSWNNLAHFFLMTFFQHRSFNIGFTQIHLLGQLIHTKTYTHAHTYKCTLICRRNFQRNFYHNYTQFANVYCGDSDSTIRLEKTAPLYLDYCNCVLLFSRMRISCVCTTILDLLAIAIIAAAVCLCGNIQTHGYE